MTERLDALEAVATEAINRTYGPMIPPVDTPEGYEIRGWLQKGIEGMRLAVALEEREARE